MITSFLVLFVFLLSIIKQKIQIEQLVFFKCTVKWRKLIKNYYNNNSKTRCKNDKLQIVNTDIPVC